MTGRIRREPRWKRFTRLAHERLESRVLLVGDLLISELMPDNNSTLADEDGHYEDWIEIHTNYLKTCQSHWNKRELFSTLRVISGIK